MWGVSPTGDTVNDMNRIMFPLGQNTPPSYGWLVGNNGVIMNTVDGSNTWTAQNSTTTQHLWDVDCAGTTSQSTSVCMAVGEGGTILTTTNGDNNHTEMHLLFIALCVGGGTWTPRTIVLVGAPPSITSADLHGVSTPSEGTAFAVGQYGLIFATTDGHRCLVHSIALTSSSVGGNTWVQQYQMITFSRLFDVSFRSDTQGVAVGEGVVAITTDGICWIHSKLRVFILYMQVAVHGTVCSAAPLVLKEVLRRTHTRDCRSLLTLVVGLPGTLVQRMEWWLSSRSSKPLQRMAKP